MRLKNRPRARGRDLRRGHVVELLVTDGLRHVDGMLQVGEYWESVGVCWCRRIMLGRSERRKATRLAAPQLPA